MSRAGKNEAIGLLFEENSPRDHSQDVFCFIVILSVFFTSAAGIQAQDVGQKQPSRLLELQDALDVLGGKGASTIHFRTTYTLGEQTKAVIDVDQAVDATGSVRENRSVVSSDSSGSMRSSRSAQSSNSRFHPSVQPDNGNIFNPAATITRILVMKDVSAERTTVTDPVTGSPREGLLLTSSANATHFLPRQVWFFSATTKLPEEVILYTLNPRGGSPLVDTVTVYRDFTDVKGMKFPHTINQTLRTGQTLTISIDEISEGATN